MKFKPGMKETEAYIAEMEAELRDPTKAADFLRFFNEVEKAREAHVSKGMDKMKATELAIADVRAAKAGSR